MKVLIKINQAREFIKTQNLKKEGKNTHSKYDYYTPEQVDDLVSKASKQFNLFNKYDLIRNELGLEGKVTVTDLDTGESETFTQVTGLAKITATNETQQYGGTVTYSERYLLQTIYGIKDNNLDPDTPQKQVPQKTQNKAQTEELSTIDISDGAFLEKWNGRIYKESEVYYNNNKYTINLAQVEALKKNPKYKQS